MCFGEALKECLGLVETNKYAYHLLLFFLLLGTSYALIFIILSSVNLKFPL